MSREHLSVATALREICNAKRRTPTLAGRARGLSAIDLVEEVVWPEQVDNPNSNHIRETLDALLLTAEDARWLHAALGEMLADTGEPQ